MDGRGCTRRSFVRSASLVAGAWWLGRRHCGAGEGDEGQAVHMATNQYPWFTFFRREGRDFNASLEASLAEVAASGVDGFEPLGTSPEGVDRLVPLLKKHGLEMRSLYVNSVLYDRQRAGASIEQVLAIAGRARRAGARIIVTNPSPIRWGGRQDKSDDQLRFQADALNQLGERLRAAGLSLAYHNHDIELRHAAREFHHMMVGTDPELVGLCLDAHWIYRGAGHSQVALFDVVELYGRRIRELHLRQSREGIWTETFGEGDIDYARLAARLNQLGVRPHLVLEQAVEKGTPKTMGPVEAHRRGLQYARRVLAVLAG